MVRTSRGDSPSFDDRAESVRGVAEVPQSEVDLWDGINLALLDRVVTAFERGHDRDPVIPRVAYLSLRSTSRRVEPPPPITPPAP